MSALIEKIRQSWETDKLVASVRIAYLLSLALSSVSLLVALIRAIYAYFTGALVFDLSEDYQTVEYDVGYGGVILQIAAFLLILSYVLLVVKYFQVGTQKQRALIAVCVIASFVAAGLAIYNFALNAHLVGLSQDNLNEARQIYDSRIRLIQVFGVASAASFLLSFVLLFFSDVRKLEKSILLIGLLQFIVFRAILVGIVNISGVIRVLIGFALMFALFKILGPGDWEELIDITDKATGRVTTLERNIKTGEVRTKP